MKNKQPKVKPIKFGKQSGTTYCFECKDYTKNLRPQEVKMTNKVLAEKSHCVVCRPNKWTTNAMCLKITNCKQLIKTKWTLILWSVEKLQKILIQKWLEQKQISYAIKMFCLWD